VLRGIRSHEGTIFNNGGLVSIGAATTADLPVEGSGSTVGTTAGTAATTTTTAATTTADADAADVTATGTIVTNGLLQLEDQFRLATDIVLMASVESASGVGSELRVPGEAALLGSVLTCPNCPVGRPCYRYTRRQGGQGGQGGQGAEVGGDRDGQCEEVSRSVTVQKGGASAGVNESSVGVCRQNSTHGGVWCGTVSIAVADDTTSASSDSRRQLRWLASTPSSIAPTLSLRPTLTHLFGKGHLCTEVGV
jgi:hypothetical protein